MIGISSNHLYIYIVTFHCISKRIRNTSIRLVTTIYQKFFLDFFLYVKLQLLNQIQNVSVMNCPLLDFSY